MSDDPFLYMILNEETLDREVGLARQHALLLTSGSVVKFPAFRDAELFQMTSVASGDTFAWQSDPTDGRVVGSYPDISLRAWNWVLPNVTTGSQLGATAITPGETYSLRIESEGAIIRGETTVPGDFTVVYLDDSDGRRLEWAPASAAAGYRIVLPNGRLQLQRDTILPLAREVDPAEVRVVALNEALWAYTTDGDLVRSGIDAGLGVFGAVTEGIR